MPNWKKVITSGSQAQLSAITMSGNILPDQDNVHSLGATNNRFLLNGGTPVTVSGTGTAGTVTRFQAATTVEDSKLFSTDTQTRLEHANSGNQIFIVSGSTGQMLSVSDEVGQDILRVNNNSGTEIFSVSSSGALVAPNLPYSSSGLVLSYDDSTGDIKYVSASAVATNYKETISGASTYAITHSLNEDYPLVQVYNSDREMVIPASIITSTANSLDVTFDSTFSGTIVIGK